MKRASMRKSTARGTEDGVVDDIGALRRPRGGLHRRSLLKPKAGERVFALPIRRVGTRRSPERSGRGEPSRGPKGAALRGGGRPTRDRLRTSLLQGGRGRLRTRSARPPGKRRNSAKAQRKKPRRSGAFRSIATAAVRASCLRP